MAGGYATAAGGRNLSAAPVAKNVMQRRQTVKRWQRPSIVVNFIVLVEACLLCLIGKPTLIMTRDHPEQ